MATPEQKIKNDICKYLSYYPTRCTFTVVDSVGIFDPVKRIYRKSKNKYRKRGIPDLIGIWQGRPLAIEVKTKTGRLTKEQKDFLEDWNQHGGIGFVARNIDDLLQYLPGLSK